MGTHHPARTITSLLAAALAVAAAGCSDASGSSGASGASGTVPAAQDALATIERIAARTGCTLAAKRDSEQLAQGTCLPRPTDPADRHGTTSKGRYTLVGFTTGAHQRSWLTEAKPWGGTYLVGERWVVVGTDRTLTALRAELGGRIVHGDRHG